VADCSVETLRTGRIHIVVQIFNPLSIRAEARSTRKVECQMDTEVAA
jgi:hypothetical protein